ncbi:MAG: response regulator [Planctomycetota bacterium]
MKADENTEKKVLIVDDDMDFIEANKAVLEEAGYNVTYALNGEDGLKVALNDKPNLIVLDVMMTTMGEGFDVARELRKNPDTKKIPLIMLTAINQKSGFPWKYDSDETWVPVDIFLEKPVKASDLLQNVRRLL